MTNERDAAIIADRLWNLADCTEDPAAQKLMLEAVRALRGQPPEPEPVDEATLVTREALAAVEDSFDAQQAKSLRDGEWDDDQHFVAVRSVIATALQEAEARGAAREVEVPDDVWKAAKLWERAEVYYYPGDPAAAEMSRFILSLNEGNQS